MEISREDLEEAGTSAEATNNPTDTQESQAETQRKDKRKRNPRFTPDENGPD